MSEPGSPLHYSTLSEAAYSEVPTEPLPPSERRLVDEYMTRRQQFLSNYERYVPIQNMQALANHVFDLTENINHMRTDFTGSRRLLDIVSTNQRDVNESIKGVAQDLEAVGSDLARVGSDLARVEREVKEDIGGFHQDLNSLRYEMQNIRQETQQGLQELKNMLTMMMGVRA